MHLQPCSARSCISSFCSCSLAHPDLGRSHEPPCCQTYHGRQCSQWCCAPTSLREPDQDSHCGSHHQTPQLSTLHHGSAFPDPAAAACNQLTPAADPQPSLHSVRHLRMSGTGPAPPDNSEKGLVRHSEGTPLSPPRAPCCSWCRLGPDRTLFTGREQGLVRWLPGRPALLVSSTSWTLDEDFGILLEALQLYDFQVRLVPASLPSRAGGGWPERLPAMYRRRVGLDSASVSCSLCLA